MVNITSTGWLVEGVSYLLKTTNTDHKSQLILYNL